MLLAEDLNLEPLGSRFKSNTRHMWSQRNGSAAGGGWGHVEPRRYNYRTASLRAALAAHTLQLVLLECNWVGAWRVVS